MQSTDARLKSFIQRTRSWPHSGDSHRANPESLADSGFYWKPSAVSPDNVVCFLCNKSLDGWTATDDPYDEHLSHSRRCGWAVIKSIPTVEDGELPFRWDDENELPKGERMTKARLETFGKWWPHEKVVGWFGTTRRMANAGFFYAPTDDSDDNVQCPYCYLGLDGWESKDDPVHEHQRRKPTCPFFATRAAAPTKASAAKANKAKRRDTTPMDQQVSIEQSLLLSPRAQCLQTPTLAKQDIPKATRVSRMLRAVTPALSPLAVHDGRAKGMPKSVQSAMKESGLRNKVKTEVRSSSPPRSVEFNLNGPSTKKPTKTSKGKTAIEKHSTKEGAEPSRRRSQRIKLEEIELSTRPTQVQPSHMPIVSLGTQGRATSEESTTSSLLNQKRQQVEDVEESSPSSVVSRSSTVSVVVPKKRRITKAGQSKDTQEVIQQNPSMESVSENPAQPVDCDMETKSVSSESSSVSTAKAALRKRKVKKVKELDEAREEEREELHDEAESIQCATRGRRKFKKTVTNEKQKKITARATKRTAKLAPTLLQSPIKKSPKALIEIFELPDDTEMLKEGPAPISTLVATAPDSTTVSMTSGSDPTTTSETMETATAETTREEMNHTDKEMEPGAVPLSLSSNGRQHDKESTPPTSPTTSVSLNVLVSRSEDIMDAPEPRVDTHHDGNEPMEPPSTPKRTQAVSMQDIETAQVVVVDPTTPIRRAASRRDIEGWEDEDRRDSSESRLSSPFVSPSKWQLDGPLLTSTPNMRRTPVLPVPSMTPRQRVKDMIGIDNADAMLSPRPSKSPGTKKTPRSIHLSPLVKHQLLIDRLENLMHENDSSKVMAVAEDALKEEVKQFRRSQNKERKLAAAAAAAAPEEHFAPEAYESRQDEDFMMTGADASSVHSNNHDVMRTPVKKAGASVLFPPTTPINKTPLPISNVISAIGAASRRNNNVSASPFVKTPLKKTIDILRLEDLEVEGGISKGSAAEIAASGVRHTGSVVMTDAQEFKSDNPFLDPAKPSLSITRLERKQEEAKQEEAKQEEVKDEQQHLESGAPRLHQDPRENERRLRLMRECGLTKRELRMTVEEFHRAILEEQVRQLELAGEAWIQRFQEESDRVRSALLDEGMR